MLVTISPAKSLNWDTVATEQTTPAMMEEANRLARTMRNRSLKDLKALMDLSDDLARLNRDRFRAFADDPDTSILRPAAFAFAGDTYQGLDFPSMADDAQHYAQDHLCILSGLYGLLRPFDGIQAYRLEMGSRLGTRRGTNLYHFWGDRIAKALNDRAAETGASTLVNCASQEYFTAAANPRLALPVVTPQFMELKDDKPRIVSFFAKRARGAMARFVMENRLTEPTDLCDFTAGGYAFEPDLSTPEKPVFLRPYPTT